MHNEEYSFSQLRKLTGPATINLEGTIQGSIIEGLNPAEISFSLYPGSEDAMKSDMDVDRYVRVKLAACIDRRASHRLEQAKEMGIITRVLGEYDPNQDDGKRMGMLNATSIDFTDRCE